MHYSHRPPNTSCLACGKPFYATPCRLASGRTKFCSPVCRWEGKHQVLKTCEWCAAEYRTWRNVSDASRTCSRLCHNRLKGRERAKPKTLNKTCVVCGAAFVTRRMNGGNKTCSAECANKQRGRPSKNNRKRSYICPECGAAFKAPPSRKRLCCSRPCQKNHKNTDEQKAISRARTVQRIADGAFASPSKVEGVVADWFTAHRLEYEPQVAVGGYFTVDFQVGAVFVEVNGCYWHGCPCQNETLSPAQRKRISQDKGRATYCRNRGITLLTIWEHDIRRGNFTALSSLLPNGGDQLALVLP